MAENKIGLISAIIAGIGALIILVMITFIVVSTLSDADLLRSTATSISATENYSWINETGYTLTGFSTANRGYSISSIINASSGDTVSVGNYTFTPSTGVLTNATTTTWSEVNLTYTYFSPTDYELTTDGLTGNFTEGIDNVSGKIPTILLIAAIVLLFGVIVLLVKHAGSMGIGTGTGGGSL